MDGRFAIPARYLYIVGAIVSSLDWAASAALFLLRGVGGPYSAAALSAGGATGSNRFPS